MLYEHHPEKGIIKNLFKTKHASGILKKYHLTPKNNIQFSSMSVYSINIGFWMCSFIARRNKRHTLIPALLHLPTASGTAARGGSIIDMRPIKHRFSTGKFTSSASNSKPSGNWSSGRLKWQKPGRRKQKALLEFQLTSSIHKCNYRQPAVLTEHSLSETSQFEVGVLESIFHLVVQRLLFALHHDGGAAVQNSFWGSFHHQQVLWFGISASSLVNGKLRVQKIQINKAGQFEHFLWNVFIFNHYQRKYHELGFKYHRKASTNFSSFKTFWKASFMNKQTSIWNKYPIYSSEQSFS